MFVRFSNTTIKKTWGKNILLSFIPFGIAFFLPWQLHENAAYYVLSSMIQGTVALLGLLIVVFVFIKGDLWEYRSKLYEDHESKAIIDLWNEPKIRKAIENMENNLKVYLLAVMIELFFALVIIIMELSIIPILIQSYSKLWLPIISYSVSFNILAILDLVILIIWGIFQVPVGNATSEVIKDKKNQDIPIEN